MKTLSQVKPPLARAERGEETEVERESAHGKQEESDEDRGRDREGVPKSERDHSADDARHFVAKTLKERADGDGDLASGKEKKSRQSVNKAVE